MKATTPPHVIVVGSHVDVVKSRGESVRETFSHLSAAVEKFLSSSLHFKFVNQVALDCREPVSKGLRRFCYLVNQSCSSLCIKADVNLRCHALYAFLLDKFKGEVACTLADVALQVKAADVLLPQNPENLFQLISSLSNSGLVLLVKSTKSIEESWIVLQKPALLTEINGTVFAPENFKEHRQGFAMSTGVVPFSKIRREFPHYNPKMIAGFFLHTWSSASR